MRRNSDNYKGNISRSAFDLGKVRTSLSFSRVWNGIYGKPIEVSTGSKSVLVQASDVTDEFEAENSTQNEEAVFESKAVDLVQTSEAGIVNDTEEAAMNDSPLTSMNSDAAFVVSVSDNFSEDAKNTSHQSRDDPVANLDEPGLVEIDMSSSDGNQNDVANASSTEINSLDVGNIDKTKVDVYLSRSDDLLSSQNHAENSKAEPDTHSSLDALILNTEQAEADAILHEVNSSYEISLSPIGGMDDFGEVSEVSEVSEIDEYELMNVTQAFDHLFEIETVDLEYEDAIQQDDLSIQNEAPTVLEHEDVAQQNDPSIHNEDAIQQNEMAAVPEHEDITQQDKQDIQNEVATVGEKSEIPNSGSMLVRSMPENDVVVQESVIRENPVAKSGGFFIPLVRKFVSWVKRMLGF